MMSWGVVAGGQAGCQFGDAQELSNSRVLGPGPLGET